MGVTFRATRLSDGATVAAKELPLHRVDSLKTTELFEREANVLRALSHPSIPAWVDHFTTGSGKQMALWILQEFIDGDTLEALAAAKRPNERAVLLTLKDLLNTLIYLGDLRPPVIHRDLKPQNLMRRRADKSFVLIDFGSVRDAIRDSLAGGSTVAGTFGYMAPEQFAGQASQATDVYGAGATALALLAGTGAERLLGSDGKLDWQGRVVMSLGLRALLERMLTPTPSDRPTALEARAEVEALLACPVAVAAPSASKASSASSRRPSAPALGPEPQFQAMSLDSPSDDMPTKSAKGNLAIVAVMYLSAVGAIGYFAIASRSPEIAIVTAAEPLAPHVAPPLGLAFGMSQAAAEAAWPALANVGPLPAEHVRVDSGYGSNPLDPSIDALISAMQADSPAVAGTAFEAPATFGRLAATCQVRFAALGGAPEASLVAFKCKLESDGRDQQSVVADALVAGWTERFGVPTGGREVGPADLTPAPLAQMGMHLNPVAALWRSSEATVQIVTSYVGVSLQGETHAWQTHSEAAVRAATEAWRRDEAEKARILKQDAAERLKGVGDDL